MEVIVIGGMHSPEGMCDGPVAKCRNSREDEGKLVVSEHIGVEAPTGQA